MIRKEDVISFFDGLAPTWDAELVRNDAVISAILDGAEVTAGKTVLDVACGTGVLIPDYLARNVASVTGIDISPRMAELARQKFPQEKVQILCGDVEQTVFAQRFDCIMVYNAFPHFPDGGQLIASLAELLARGGTLTVAHGMSREKIDSHHRGAACNVSNGLMPAEELADIFASRGLLVTHCISDDAMYQVTGRRTAD